MHAFFSELAEPINYCNGSRAMVAASMNHSDRIPIAGYKEDGVRSRMTWYLVGQTSGSL